jgi:ESS family glutamate:Na+ symporter
MVSLIMASLLLANVCKRVSKALRNSLVPVSVIAGLLLLAISVAVKQVTGSYLFNYQAFTGGADASGVELLEIITYHCLAIGFIAMALRKTGKVTGKERAAQVLDTGIITVSTYLLQGIVGMALTIGFSFLIPTLLKASGLLLAFGYGQGSGQALNYGSIYEAYGFVGGKSFGLTVAAMGFLSAAVGGVLYLNHLRRKGLVQSKDRISRQIETVEQGDEIPMNDSVDKLTIQLALIFLAYALSYLLMHFLGDLVGPGLKATIYGFNFLIGVLVATALKGVLALLRVTFACPRYECRLSSSRSSRCPFH